MTFFVPRFPEVFAEMILGGVTVDFKSVIEVFRLTRTELNLGMARITENAVNNYLKLENYQNNIKACLYLISILLKIRKTEEDESDLHRAVYNFNRPRKWSYTLTFVL